MAVESKRNGKGVTVYYASPAFAAEHVAVPLSGGRQTIEMMRGEFVERFASHILPLHSRRIRYVGRSAPKGRYVRLKECRRLIAMQKHGDAACEAENKEQVSSEATDDEVLMPNAERRALFTSEDNKRRRSYPARCRMCKKPMEPLEQMDGQLTLRILPYLIGVIAWLSGKAEGPPKNVPMMVPEHLRVFVAAEQQAEQRRQQQDTETENAAIPEHPPP